MQLFSGFDDWMGDLDEISCSWDTHDSYRTNTTTDLISRSLNGVWDEDIANANQARMIMRCAQITQNLKIPTILINLELAAAYMIELINVRLISLCPNQKRLLIVGHSHLAKREVQPEIKTNILIV